MGQLDAGPGKAGGWPTGRTTGARALSLPLDRDRATARRWFRQMKTRAALRGFRRGPRGRGDGMEPGESPEARSCWERHGSGRQAAGHATRPRRGDGEAAESRARGLEAKQRTWRGDDWIRGGGGAGSSGSRPDPGRCAFMVWRPWRSSSGCEQRGEKEVRSEKKYDPEDMNGVRGLSHPQRALVGGRRARRSSGGSAARFRRRQGSEVARESGMR